MAPGSALGGRRVVPGGAPVEVPVLAATAAIMGLVAATAGAIPAVRAVGVDAVEAMRDG